QLDAVGRVPNGPQRRQACLQLVAPAPGGDDHRDRRPLLHVGPQLDQLQLGQVTEERELPRRRTGEPLRAALREQPARPLADLDDRDGPSPGQDGRAPPSLEGHACSEVAPEDRPHYCNLRFWRATGTLTPTRMPETLTRRELN